MLSRPADDPVRNRAGLWPERRSNAYRQSQIELQFVASKLETKICYDHALARVNQLTFANMFCCAP